MPSRTDDRSSVFNQPILRKADYYQPKNMLKEKLGFGGIDPMARAKAEAQLAIRAERFADEAGGYIDQLRAAVGIAAGDKGTLSTDQIITLLLEPVFHLKSNSAMFGFPVLSMIAERMIEFIEIAPRFDRDALDILRAFIRTLQTLLALEIREEADPRGRAVITELMGVCSRYFERRARL